MRMFKGRVLGALNAAVVSIALSCGVFAGPFADFERALAAAYGPFKAALFQTNQKDKAGTEKSLAAFEAQWGPLMKTYRSAPPPQYADDAGWPATVAAVEKLIALAKAETEKGDLAKAHDALEGVRDELGNLRLRNGVVVFSDRVDAFHEHMEHVVVTKYSGSDGIATLREDAAVLVHLAGLVEKNAPAGFKSEAAFNEGLSAMVGAAKALLAAARNGDAESIGKAMKGLKPAYAKFFVKYG